MEIQLTISVTNNDKIVQHESIKSNDLVQLMAQLGLLVVRLQRQLHEDELMRMKGIDDDIPF